AAGFVYAVGQASCATITSEFGWPIVAAVNGPLISANAGPRPVSVLDHDPVVDAGDARRGPGGGYRLLALGPRVQRCRPATRASNALRHCLTSPQPEPWQG